MGCLALIYILQMELTVLHSWCTHPILTIHGDQGKYGRITCPNFITENTTGYTENLIVQDCGHVAYNKKPMKIINTIDNL